MNKELARIFFEIAAILDAGGESFKPQAYRKAARALLELAEDAALDLRPGRAEGPWKRFRGWAKASAKKLKNMF